MDTLSDQFPSNREEYIDYIDFYDALLEEHKELPAETRLRFEAIRDDLQTLMEGAAFTEKNVRSLRTACQHVYGRIHPSDLGIEGSSVLEEDLALDSLMNIVQKLRYLAEQHSPLAQNVLANLVTGNLPTTPSELLILLAMYRADTRAENERTAHKARQTPKA